MPAKLDHHGHERGSDKPIAMPTGMKRPETLQEQISRLVRSEHFNRAMGQPDHETYDEADDFDVGEDYDPLSPYEQVFDPILQEDISPADFLANQAIYRKKYEDAMIEEMPIEQKPDPLTIKSKKIEPEPEDTEAQK